MKARVRQCARLLAAWPQARIANVDATLLEYLNATRGVPLSVLPRVVQAVIDAGGEFIPPAAAILDRAARTIARGKQRTYSPVASIEERIEWDRHDLVEAFQREHRAVLPIEPGDLGRALGAGDDLPAIEAEVRA